jgi:hypothetical protein
LQHLLVPVSGLLVLHFRQPGVGDDDIEPVLVGIDLLAEGDDAFERSQVELENVDLAAEGRDIGVDLLCSGLALGD